MKIKDRLLLAFLPIIVFILIMSIYSSLSLQRLSVSVNELTNLNIAVTETVTTLRHNSEEYIRTIEEYDSDWIERAELDAEIAELKSEQGQLLQTLATYEKGIDSALVNKQKFLIDELYDDGNAIILIHGKSREERTATMEEFDEHAEDTDVGYAAMQATSVNKMNNEVGIIQQKIHEGTVAAVTIGILFALFSIIMALTISRSVVRSINELSDAALKMAKGDLRIKVTNTTQDELGELAQQFNSLSDTVNRSHQTLEAKVESKTNELKAMQDKTTELESKLKELRKVALA